MPPTLTRRIILQKARRHPLRPVRKPAAHFRLRLLVGVGVQVLFHPPRGVLFTLPSRYSCTIGGQEYSSLGGWSPQLPTGFPVSRGTQERRPPHPPSGPPTGLSPPAVPPSSGFGPPTARVASLLTTSFNPVWGEPHTVWAAARLARHYYGPLTRPTAQRTPEDARPTAPPGGAPRGAPLDFSSSGYLDV